MTDVASIDRVFDLLDAYRHLPAYQLERRADVFFALYMRDVVQAHVGVPLQESLIPELPLRRDLIWPEKPSGKSVKVDYLLTSKTRNVAVLVELKTDVASRRNTQDAYLLRARELGMRRILEGLVSIMGDTKAHGKYLRLARRLHALGWLQLPADLQDGSVIRGRRRNEALKEIVVSVPSPSKIEIVYVQPHAGGGCCIDFEMFAAHVMRFSDPLSQRLARSLLAWRDTAGEEPGG